MDCMRILSVVLLLVVAGALGALGGYLARGGIGAGPGIVGGGGQVRGESNAAARIELAKLRVENEELNARLESMLRESERRPVEAVPAPAVAKAAKRPSRGPLALGSVEEADAVLADAVAHLDLEQALRLGAALLAMGEEGYEKFLALMKTFGEAVRGDEVVGTMFGDERNAGLALRYCAENIENLLKFGLYLQGREGDDLPEEARFLRDQFDRELGRVLLGFQGGANAEIENGMFELCARKIKAARDDGNERTLESAIDALSMLRSERATDLLLELAENAPPGVAQKIVLGLVYQGTPRALAGIRTLMARAQDPKQVEALESLLARLGVRAEE
jgi:hypothetical protein